MFTAVNRQTDTLLALRSSQLQLEEANDMQKQSYVRLQAATWKWDRWMEGRKEGRKEGEKDGHATVWQCRGDEKHKGSAQRAFFMVVVMKGSTHFRCLTSNSFQATSLPLSSCPISGQPMRKPSLLLLLGPVESSKDAGLYASPGSHPPPYSPTL